MTDPTAGAPPTPSVGHRRTSATGTSRVLALDGLRAFALLIIMGYHFGVGWLQGGFFSLDIFYVLSGYLITGLLLGEWARAARIKLGAFWLRRARRLLPALLVVLVVVTLVIRFAYPAGLYPNLRMADLSALFYFSNWWQIAASGNYFVATGAISPLTHTWSLAVEEQFYLVWPLVVVAVLHIGKRFDRGIEILLGVSLVGVIASATEMAFLYGPRANITRLYFGTDTHAQSILVGAVLACVLTLVQRRRGLTGMAPVATSTPARVILTLVGLAGFAGTLALTKQLTGTDALAYRGGFLLSALSAAAIILGAVCVTGGPIAAFLSLRPMVWMGTVSYGAYLWHYPVFIELDAARTGLTGLSLLLVRGAATFVLAGASYYLVERPVMEGVFWRSLKAAGPAIAAMGVTVVVVVAGTTAVATAASPVAVQPFRGSGTAHDPPKVVILGDSTALTLGYALAATAPPGTAVDNGGLYGCGLAVASWVSNNPPNPQLQMFPACNEATPASGQWPALDATRVSGTRRGDIILFVAGTWEVQDMLRGGTWSDIDQPSFQRYELDQMEEVIRIGTAHGAHFDFATMPAIGSADDSLEASRADQSQRQKTYNRLIDEVAARHPDTVSVVDYGRIISPGGVFHEYLDGVQVRSPDGVHTPAYAPGNAFAGNASEPVAGHPGHRDLDRIGRPLTSSPRQPPNGLTSVRWSRPPEMAQAPSR
jgi:peptidoglycan/LPS O-acetylase OafA/YrhL